MIYKYARWSAYDHGRDTKTDDSKTYKRRSTGDFLYQHDDREVGGVEDSHGDQLCQPQEQEVPVLEECMKPSVWSGCIHYTISSCITLVDPTCWRDLVIMFYTVIQ